MAAALLLTGAAVVGCSEETPERDATGPLITGGDSGSLCVPIGRHREATIAFDNLRTTKQVVIERIGLVEADGMQVRSAELMPIQNDLSLGVWPGYPPKEARSDRIAWDQRREAARSTLHPGDPRMEVVLRVEITEPVATAKATEVHYTADGRPFVARTTTRFELRGGKTCGSSS